MKRFKNIIALSLIPFNTLLLFFLIVEDKLVIPAWVQVFGRMHPVMLHFPIVFMLLYGAFILFTPAKYKREVWFKVIAKSALLAAAFTSAVTALMGLLLSKESGYDEDAIAWHKYTGVAISFVLFTLYSFGSWLQQHLIVYKVFITLASFILIWAGHMGANITHGENFMLAPVTPENKKPVAEFEDALLYADLIDPILQSKCVSCHNNNKAKGELIIETKELLLKGGKNGKLWDTTKADLGLLLNRIHLPLEDKKHMPPSGKPQLTEEETAVLYSWIKSGAEFEKRVIELNPTDTLRILAAKILKQSSGELYSFAAADEKEVQKLNNTNRVIAPLAISSPGLVVNFYNKPFYNSKQLQELQPISEQIVELNLDNMPVTDEDIKIIGQFKNLRRLNLNFTPITGNTLGELKNLLFLRSLSLSGTTVKAAQLRELLPLPKLRTVYLWNTSVALNDIEQLVQQNKNIIYHSGFKGDTVILKLTPPILQNEEQIITESIPLKLKHYINGTTIRYTLDDKEPDSLVSPVFNNDVMINSEVTIKTKAFKPGWISSDVISQHFFKSTYVADSAVLLTKTDAKYKANGGKTLIDLEKGDFNFGAGKWLGYRENDFAGILIFNNPVNATSVTLSMLKDIGGHIFPPVKIEVWGGNNINQLVKLAQVFPEQPRKDSPNQENLALQCKFKSKNLKFVKLVAQPVNRLPTWHPGKGAKGWIMIDEVFVN